MRKLSKSLKKKMVAEAGKAKEADTSGKTLE